MDNGSSALSRRVVIVNRKGLHARAAAKFVKLAESFAADIVVLRSGMEAGGTSIMGLMMLAASPGTEIEIRSSGDEAEPALAALVVLVEGGFGEELAD
ncbi:MAG: HPr family phosphocarrier protein [Alphaproteobacteria bacterium]|nr:HPr family phosphocarrier protein [Alphaproteobacteria bacterium]